MLISASTIATRGSSTKQLGRGRGERLAHRRVAGVARRIVIVTTPPPGRRRPRRAVLVVRTRGTPARARRGRVRRPRGRPSRTRRADRTTTRARTTSCGCRSRAGSGSPSPRCGASVIASQLEPSLSSASPQSTTTRWSERPFARSASATPTAIGRPWPSEPVDASMPGTSVRSGCEPSRPPCSMKSSSQASGKNPFAARIAYSATGPCPLLRMNRSRSSAVGPRRVDAQHSVVQHPERVERAGRALLVLLVAGRARHQRSHVREPVGRGIHGGVP